MNIVNNNSNNNIIIITLERNNSSNKDSQRESVRDRERGWLYKLQYANKPIRFRIQSWRYPVKQRAVARERVGDKNGIAYSLGHYQLSILD